MELLLLPREMTAWRMVGIEIDSSDRFVLSQHEAVFVVSREQTLLAEFGRIGLEMDCHLRSIAFLRDRQR